MRIVGMAKEGPLPVQTNESVAHFISKIYTAYTFISNWIWNLTYYITQPLQMIFVSNMPTLLKLEE